MNMMNFKLSQVLGPWVFNDILSTEILGLRRSSSRVTI